MKSKYFDSRKITTFAILLAMIVVLQLFGSAFVIGTTRLSFVLVPIVVGAFLIGPLAGGILGLSFGLVVTLMAVFGLDPFTLFMLQDNLIVTLLIIFVKGFLAGFVPGVVYNAIKKKNETVSVFVSSALAPIVNTGVFVLGALIMSGTMTKIINASPETQGQSVIYFVIIACAGVNFLIELAINLILAPSLHRVVKIVDKKFK